VDGPTYVSDAYIDPDGAGSQPLQWRTLVSGSLGSGGRGVYALDVTDTLKTGAAPRVIFDLSAGDGSAVSNDLGYGAGRVNIVPVIVNNGASWQAIFGNGTNSNNGISKLIAVDITNPSTIHSINTTAKFAGNLDNGLSGPALLPDGTGVVTHAYAGDAMGNLWKFDLSNYSVAYRTGSTPKPLINLMDSTGAAQAITATPTLGLNALKTVGTGANATAATMVYVGTGKYSETTDVSNNQVQSMYAIADVGMQTLTTGNRTTLLHQKTIIAQTANSRTVDKDTTPVATGIPAVDWANKVGWFLDLKLSTGSAEGERVLAKPLLLYDRLIFPTFIPSANQCDTGGKSWLMELTAVGDKFIGHTIVGIQPLPYPVIADIPALLDSSKVTLLPSGLDNDPNGKPAPIQGNLPAGTTGRLSWRQLK
jgi:type IV pilus assembly protein PilY1